MDILIQKYKRDPNGKVDSVYSGIASGGRTVTTVRRPSADQNQMETTRVYGPPLPRGEGGRVGVLVLGGMETSLDEMEYILEAKRQKPFVPRRTNGEVADMCRDILIRRNELIEELRKTLLTRMAPKPPKRTVKIHLPVGCRYMPTREAGLKVLVRDNA